MTSLNQGLFSTTMEAEKRDPGNEVGKVVVGKRVGLPTEKATKVDLIYFAGFKCALEDCYKHQHINIHSRFVLKIAYGLELLAKL